MTSISDAAAVVLGATTAAGATATALLVRSRAVLARRERELRDEFHHLVTARLPGLALNLISSHHPVPGMLHAHLAGTADAEPFDAALGHLANTVLKERRRIDAAARAALRGACQDIQALSYRLQTKVEALQGEFDDPRLIDSLFSVDHLNEQAIRLVQKAAIVCGAWPGHVRPDTYVVEVVSGASSRLHGYERIKISSQLFASNIGVVGRAAEPVAVACAELMANALESSRDDLAVEVRLVQTENGSICVIVDDAGKGMSAEARARGVRLVSGEEQQDLLLTELGDPPALGFAAIGRLVADYGFQVSVDRPSPYGGVCAVVTISPHLLTSIDEQAEPLSAMAPLPAVPPLVPQWPAPPRPPATASASPDGSGLPQRRRRARTAPPARTDGPAPEPRVVDPEQARDTWTQFQEGITAGRADTDPEETP